MDIAHERAVIAAIARFIVRAGVSVLAGLFVPMLVAWCSESLGLLSGWAFMHSNFALPTLLASAALTFWATGFIPFLKGKRGRGNAV